MLQSDWITLSNRPRSGLETITVGPLGTRRGGTRVDDVARDLVVGSGGQTMGPHTMGRYRTDAKTHDLTCTTPEPRGTETGRCSHRVHAVREGKVFVLAGGEEEGMEVGILKEWKLC